MTHLRRALGHGIKNFKRPYQLTGAIDLDV